MNRGILCAIIVPIAAGSAAAVPDFSPDSAVFVFDGEAAGDELGRRIYPTGDVDNDGWGDFLITARFNDGGGVDSGRVYVISGQTFEELHRFTGEMPDDELGHRLATFSDVNGDGHADILIAAYDCDVPGVDAGRVYVHSGATGELLHLWSGEAAGDRFGYDVSNLGDTDFDGVDDVLVTAPWNSQGNTNAGKAYVFSGATGELRYSIVGDQSGELLGFRARVVGDANGDTVADFLVSAHKFTAEGRGALAGQALLVSGADGSILHAFLGESEGEMFGERISRAGDVNDDGVEDFAIASLQFDGARGKVCVYSGATYELLWSREGELQSDQFGDRLQHVGDLNQDGFDDLVVGARYNSDIAFEAGRVYALSGLDGSVLYQWSGTRERDQLGLVIERVGDVNGDGHPDVLVGSGFTDFNGSDSGRVTIHSGRTGRAMCTFTGSNQKWSFGFSSRLIGRLHPDGPEMLSVGAALADTNGIDSGRAYLFELSPIFFRHTHAIAGDEAEFDIAGTFPNETAHLMLSFIGTAPNGGPPLPAFGGLVIDILSPVYYIGTALADDNGEATVTFDVPRSMRGQTVWMQALIHRGIDGIDSVKSNVDKITIQ